MDSAALKLVASDLPRRFTHVGGIGVDIADHWLFSSGNRYVLATNRKLKVTTPRPNLALQAAAYHEAGSRPGRRNLGVVLRSRCTYYA